MFLQQRIFLVPNLKHQQEFLRIFTSVIHSMIEQAICKNNAELLDKQFVYSSSITFPALFKQVRETLFSRDVNKSSDLDDIFTIVLRRCAFEIVPSSDRLLQTAYDLGIFPNSYKTDIIRLDPKKNFTISNLDFIANDQIQMSGTGPW